MILRDEVFNCLINELNKIKYCILRNYSSLPEFGNDIDILVDYGTTEVLINRLNVELAILDVIFLYKVDFSCTSLYYYDLICENFIHIDLFESNRWHIWEYINAKKVLESRIKYKSFYIPSAQYEMFELLLTRLLYQNKIKEKYKDRILEIFNNSFFENKTYLEEMVLKNIAEGFEKIEKKVYKIKLMIIAKNLVNPQNLFLNSLALMRRTFFRAFNLPGMLLFIDFRILETNSYEKIKKIYVNLFSDKIYFIDERYLENKSNKIKIRTIAKILCLIKIYFLLFRHSLVIIDVNMITKSNFLFKYAKNKYRIIKVSTVSDIRSKILEQIKMIQKT